MFEVEAGADEKQQIKFVWPYSCSCSTIDCIDYGSRSLYKYNLWFNTSASHHRRLLLQVRSFPAALRPRYLQRDLSRLPALNYSVLPFASRSLPLHLQQHCPLFMQWISTSSEPSELTEMPHVLKDLQTTSFVHRLN